MGRPWLIVLGSALALAGCVDPVVIGASGDGAGAETGDDGGGEDEGGVGIGPGCSCGPVSGVVLLDDLGALWRFDPDQVSLELLGDIGCDERFGPRPAPTGVGVGSNGDGFVLYPDDAVFRVAVDEPERCEVLVSSDEVSVPGPGEELPGVAGLPSRSSIAHVDRVDGGACGMIAGVREAESGVVVLDRWLPGDTEPQLLAAFEARDGRLTAGSGGRLYAFLLRDGPDSSTPAGASQQLDLVEIDPGSGGVLSRVSLPAIVGLWSDRNVITAHEGPEGDELLVFIAESDGTTTVVRARFPEADGRQPTVELVVEALPIAVRDAAATPC